MANYFKCIDLGAVSEIVSNGNDCKVVSNKRSFAFCTMMSAAGKTGYFVANAETKELAEAKLEAEQAEGVDVVCTHSTWKFKGDYLRELVAEQEERNKKVVLDAAFFNDRQMDEEEIEEFYNAGENYEYSYGHDDDGEIY